MHRALPNWHDINVASFAIYQEVSITSRYLAKPNIGYFPLFVFKEN